MRTRVRACVQAHACGRANEGMAYIVMAYIGYGLSRYGLNSYGAADGGNPQLATTHAAAPQHLTCVQTCTNMCMPCQPKTYGHGLYSYGLYSYGLGSYGLHSHGEYSYGLYSYDIHSYGLHSYALYSYGLYSYGLYSYGLYSYGIYSYGHAGRHSAADTCWRHECHKQLDAQRRLRPREPNPAPIYSYGLYIVMANIVMAYI